MKKIIEYFLKNPLVVNLFTFLILFVGLLTVWNMRKESFPKIDMGLIIVRINYPGSSAEDVEKLVTIEVERSLKGVLGIKTMNAMSAEGSSIIYIETEAESDVDEVYDDIKAAIDSIEDLPEETTVPKITKMDSRWQGVLKIALTGGDYQVNRDAAKDLRDELEELSEIAIVDMEGYYPDEIKIFINLQKMKNLDVSVGEIFTAIQNRNLNLSAGKLENDKSEIIVRTVSEFANINEIKNLVIRSNTMGQNVKISDIADVERSPVKGKILQRSQGKSAVFLNINIKENADIINSVDNIQNVVEKFFKKDAYKGLNFAYLDDISYYVKRRLGVLKDNGIIGMILVFICLLLFLDFRTSFVTSLGAPLAFMISFVAMSFMGITINLISMFALILVLGMLVDDSIIVAEQFYQNIEKGLPSFEAAQKAAFETIAPVFATILTTMIAFGALFFMGGTMGKFLWMVPAVVIICLAASLFECFFILPSHLADFCGKNKNSDQEKKWYLPIKKFYSTSLKLFLKYPYIIVLTFSLLFIASVEVAKRMRFELFPGDDARVVFLQIKGPVGTPLEKTDLAAQRLEKLIFEKVEDKTELEQLKSQIGVFKEQHSLKTGSHYASLILYLTSPDERKRSTDQIVNSLLENASQLVPDYSLTIEKYEGGPPKGKPVEIEVKGDSLEVLQIVAKKIQNVLKYQKGVTSTELDFEEGREQIQITVDDENSRRLGVSALVVAAELRKALGEDEISKIREADEDIEIKIYLKDKSSIDFINQLSVQNIRGQKIPLSNLVKINKTPGAFVIRRIEGERVISVIAFLDKAKTSPVKIAKAMKKPVKEILKDHPLIDVSFGGENKDTNESMVGLAKSFIIAILCIFFVLVIMFRSLGLPLIIMAAIPLGLIGVILAFLVFNQALGFMAMMGVVGLVGVVVNDSIVLVNFINIKKDERERPLRIAIHDACLDRLRPVLLTTFTTVAGLLPIAHGVGGDPFLKPMALSFAWGLFFATTVTLVFIPCSYLIYIRLVAKIKNLVYQIFQKS